VENDAYGDLRYSGEPLPALKQLEERGGAVLLRSFSKISFPGLRVGWALGPKPLIDRLRQAKEASDLHTDQLSQAVLLEFAESGRLETHRTRVLQAGGERLRATLEGCREFLPAGTRWTRPEGGMNVWVRLPEPLDAEELHTFANNSVSQVAAAKLIELLENGVLENCRKMGQYLRGCLEELQQEFPEIGDIRQAGLHIGVELVREVAVLVRTPFFAIGGITLDNIGRVLAAGATRVAVVSALLKAPDVTEAAAEFKRQLGSLK